MEELIVITACLYQKGCTESASTLYNQRPHLKAYVGRMETEAKKVAGPVVTNYMAPVVVFASGGSGAIRISESVGVKGRRDYIELFFKREF